MPEGPPPRKLSGWEVELGPGHWAALSGRVLSSDVNVSWTNKWVFPKIGIPQNGWFIMENPIKMDDLGIPLLLERPKLIFCSPGILP